MASPSSLARVVVVGTSCSGKSTLARRLATLLDAPCVELDALYWGPGWVPRSDFRESTVAAALGERWVIDGNYSLVRDFVWRRATAIVWLDYSFPRTFAQAMRRTIRRIVTREPLYGGSNRETIRGAFFDATGIPWWVLRTHRKRRREYPELLRRPEYGHATVVQLRTPRATEAFLVETKAGILGTSSRGA